MKTRSIIFVASIGLFLASCSGLTVVTDMDKSVDFSQYKTLEYYGWADNSGQQLNDLDRGRIENAFGEEFKKRGMSFVETGDGGDLIVTLHIVGQEKTQLNANTTGTGAYGGGYGGYYGYGPGYGWGGGYSTTTVTEYNYTVGTLLISVYDAEKKQLVWESRGEKTVDENPKNAEEKMAKIAEKMMYDFPVKPLQ